MRRWLIAVAWVSTMGACGGGGGGSGGGGVSGTIGGQTFNPAGVSAAIAGPSTCTVQSQSVSVKAFALRFADFADVCTDLQSDPICKIKGNARTVTILFADIGAISPPTLGAGTFTLTTDPTSLTSAEAHTSPTDPLVGTLSLAFGGVVMTGASCSMSAAPQVAQGTLRVDAVTSTAITGSVNLTFGTMNGSTFVPGADKLSGNFTAALCSPISDICSLADTGGTCSSPTCT